MLQRNLTFPVVPVLIRIIVRVEGENPLIDICNELFVNSNANQSRCNTIGQGPEVMYIVPLKAIEIAFMHKLDLFVKTPRQPGARWG